IIVWRPFILHLHLSILSHPRQPIHQPAARTMKSAVSKARRPARRRPPAFSSTCLPARASPVRSLCLHVIVDVLDETSLHSFFSYVLISVFGSFSTSFMGDPPDCFSMISAESDRKS